MGRKRMPSGTVPPSGPENAGTCRASSSSRTVRPKRCLSCGPRPSNPSQSSRTSHSRLSLISHQASSKMASRIFAARFSEAFRAECAARKGSKASRTSWSASASCRCSVASSMSSKAVHDYFRGEEQSFFFFLKPRAIQRLQISQFFRLRCQ